MTRHTLNWMALVGAFALAAPMLSQAAEPAMAKDGMMVDHHGMTLYTYDKDADGKSNCNDKCAENWPPLMAASGAKDDGDWTVVKRDDGKMQWAFGGKPLYTFKMDKKAGDKMGDGKMDVWHVVPADADAD
ncbi:COG4315 family predicted lipoprotein [Pseudomonas sp. TE3610]